MKWDPVSLSRFARDGGFVSDEQATAVAVALASSAGIANYELRAGAPGAGHWKGLWAIDTDRHPDYADLDLFVPQHAARAAHDLVTETGGWDWNAAYRLGHHLMHLARAGTARTMETSGPSPGLPLTVHETSRSLDRQYARLTLLHSQLRPIDHQRIR